MSAPPCIPIRNNCVDSLKGFLLLLVIIGHIMLGTIDGNIIRYIIYSFHMPLFMFISGYMVNIQKIANFNLVGIFQKYWRRMLKEWGIAVLVYSITLCAINKNMSFLFFLKNTIVPYYHLWYVPVLFIMILSSWMIECHIKSKWEKLFIYVCIGLLLCGINNTGTLSWFRLRYFIFFYFGLVCKDFCICIKSRPLLIYVCILLYISVLSMSYYFGISYDSLEKLFLIPIDLTLCFWIVLPFMCENKLKSRLLEYLGIHSLPIYLWHVLPIMVMKSFVHNTMLYYIFTIEVFIAFILFARYKSNQIRQNN